MAKTSDIAYHLLETTYQQYLRQASLQAANDRISNGIAALPIFPHYSFGLDTVYGSVDGQKFGVGTADRKGPALTQVFWPGRHGCRRLHAAVQSCPAARLDYRRA